MRERASHLHAREALFGRTDFAAFLADFVLLAIVDVFNAWFLSLFQWMRPLRDAVQNLYYFCLNCFGRKRGKMENWWPKPKITPRNQSQREKLSFSLSLLCQILSRRFSALIKISLRWKIFLSLFALSSFRISHRPPQNELRRSAATITLQRTRFPRV